jgi:hypothetical protein
MTWRDRRVDVGVRDKKIMHNIGANGVNVMGVSGGTIAVWRERMVLRKDTHHHRTVRFHLAAQIALDEFAAHV